MRRSRQILTAMLALAAALILCTSTVRAQKSIDEKLDIAALMIQAGERFDLSTLDAILLYDSRRVDWLNDGRREMSVHRIVWISTDRATELYGDYRVPFDNDNCTIDVKTVRTWMDGRWWVTGPTGIVETLPRGLRDAYDYTNMREMMLLHDGIELPCILEVSFTIRDRQPFRGGVEGMWLFARPEPCIQSQFQLRVPVGREPRVFASDDAPPPAVLADDRGLQVYTWTMGPLEALPRPLTDDPAAYVPHVTWSTRNSWNEFGKSIGMAFGAAASIDENLRQSLDSLLDTAPTNGKKAELVASFVKDRTTFINYPEEYWRTLPRPAARTYATAYGHRLDRAVLAAALFEYAGIESVPVWFGNGHGDVDEGVPSLARFGGVNLWIKGDDGDLSGYFDPARAEVINGTARTFGRTVWMLRDGQPEMLTVEHERQNLNEIHLELAYDTTKKKFAGSGYFCASGYLSSYDRMVGLGEEARDYLASVLSGVISGAKVTSCNPGTFSPDKVVFGFEVELKKPEADDQGRLPLVIGLPSSGIKAALPGDVRVWHQQRSTPVTFPGAMRQKIELRLKTKGLDIVYRPTVTTLENGGGKFTLAIAEKNGLLRITRELNLTRAAYTSGEWPDLRALLLADGHERNQTVLLKIASKE